MPWPHEGQDVANSLHSAAELFGKRVEGDHLYGSGC